MDSALIPALATVGGATVGAAVSYAAASRQARAGLELSRTQFELQRAAELDRDRRDQLTEAYRELASWLHRLVATVRDIDGLPAAELHDQLWDRVVNEVTRLVAELRNSLSSPPESAALAQCLWSDSITGLVGDLRAECAR